MNRAGKLAPEVNRQIRQGMANNTKGTAFVVYEDVMDAKQACDKLNGFNFQNRYLVVLYHQPEKMLKSKEDLAERQENLERLKKEHNIERLQPLTGRMYPPSKPSAFVSSTLSQSIIHASTSTVSPFNTTTDGVKQAGAENGDCRLLGPFALFIQGALGILALSSLVFKRWRERPQRPVRIWAFDASKQVVGSGLLHVANLLLSMISSGELTPSPKAGDYQANPCSFYLLNLAMDTTIGIPILIILLRLLTHGFLLTPFGEPPESIESGNYGRPPKTKWWFKQCFIYFLGLIGMKLCVYFIFKLCPWIIQIGDWALKWTEGDERIQVFFVMLFFPLVMNALQYYIIDSFIKDKKPSDHEAVPSEEGSDDDNDSQLRQRRSQEVEHPETLSGNDEVNAIKEHNAVAGVGDAVIPPTSGRLPPKQEEGKGAEEYDPALDGEASGSSASVTPKDPPSSRGKDGAAESRR
ncbi:uncharacterized protein KY384_002543 [Bacidia gigantensis]|uniref:uncharacterized protein n=1 Tax=Bacidia gigantensis TaxID=2732470 RepID=UPI001D0506DE|nr:uncharacterized protein KY384_002543 [Bacidia gigantensis]KAG8532666.1 hypothetical protein KY384_002543 [Bacidia gigantensis]